MLNVPNCENVWAEVSTNLGSIIFAVIYRHLCTNFLVFENVLCNTTELENQKLKYVVSGDININHLAFKGGKSSSQFQWFTLAKIEL